MSAHEDSPAADASRPFEGAINFRDFGGQATREGRRVARGRLFRSDALWQLSDADLERFAALGVRTLCDFRAEHERLRWPNRLPADPAPRLVPVGFSPRGAAEAWAAVNRGELDPQGVLQYMRDHYHYLATEHAAHYAQMFAAMLEPDGLPLLVHCASGKDRTGFAAAVILLALGVPREAIVADYVISDRNRRELSHLFEPHVDPRCYNAVGAAAPDYLASAFAAIDSGWGDESCYLREAMGLDASALCRLRDLLLE